jgi:phospholipid/cholesterol/gamma-HCH transport system substrate-binding protein
VISRVTRFQVIVFAVLSAVAVSFVGIRYVGLGDRLFGRTYVVTADFAATGGVFSHAPVTYRGVPIGQVGAITLSPDGVRIALRLDRGTPVPADLTAVVAHRSAVGEPYVDLRPRTGTGPFLRDGDTIPRERTSLPLPMETLLAGLDALVGSVGPDNVATVIDELGTALEGDETALRTLLDASGAILADADRYLPQTVGLIENSRTVLATQLESAGEIRRWAAALARLAATLRAADPDLRRLLAQGPPAATELLSLLRGLDPSIGVLLGNLITVDSITVRRLSNVEQALVVFPVIVAGGFTTAPGDGTAHFGLVVNVNDPPPCNYTRSGTVGCTAAEQAHGADVRGSGRAPRAGPGSASSGSAASSGPARQPGPPAPSEAQPAALAAGFDPATGAVLGPDGQPMLFGGTGGQDRIAGDQSWKQLLLAGLAP